MEKQGFIYIWYDRWRKMYYLGCHWGTEDDGYICSSNRMRDAYRRRPKDFKRRIIQKDIPRNQLLDVEHQWLQLIEDRELGKKYYNLRKQKFDRWYHDEGKRESVRQKISLTLKGRTLSDEHKRKVSEYLRGNKRATAGKGTPKPPRTEEHRRKLSEAGKGKSRIFTEEHKRKLRKPKPPRSEEHRRKISEHRKQYYATRKNSRIHYSQERT